MNIYIAMNNAVAFNENTEALVFDPISSVIILIGVGVTIALFIAAVFMIYHLM